MAKTAPLRLLAQDAEDLAIVSAALQDAVAKIGDISFEPRTRRLTIAFNRYRWEAGASQRIRSALQIGGVMAVQTRRIQRDRSRGVVQLLALSFEPSDPPGGLLTLAFSGDADLRARVECVDLILADLSPPWPTPRTPTHDSEPQ